ncbi:MAG: Mur ligase family protein, partial [Bacteroidota bacterium]
MKALRLTDLDYSASGTLAGTATGVAYDSRKVKPGDLFVALVGEKTDGHQYLEQAFQQGAVAAVVQHLPENSDKPLLLTEDTRLALADLSARLYDHPSRAMKVVGVTGTNGKTTTTHMIEGILRADAKRAGVIGTLGSHFEGKEIPTHHTTPQALELQEIFAAMREAGIQGVAMEASSHALDQDRVAWTDFDVAVWTNLTRDHLDYHQTMEQYAQAKAKLFRGLAGAAPEWGIVNRDDPAWETFMGLCPRTMTYGLSDADVRAEGVRLLPDGSLWTLATPQGAV